MPRRIKGGALSVSDTKSFVEQSYLKTSQRNAAVGSYQLDRALSNDRAAVYYDQGTNCVVVANRGTAGTLSDWANNLALVRGQYTDTDRWKNALDTQMKVRAKYPGWKITNVAHSQSQAIVTELNRLHLTDEVITLNGATMPWDKQAANETRIRSGHDLVSAIQTLGTTKKRNTTIKPGGFNFLKEHSASILDSLDPMHLFGKGVNSLKKKSFDEHKTTMPRFEPWEIERAYKGGKIGMNVLHALGKAAVTGIESGSTRLTSAIDGSDPHSDATYGSGFGSIHKIKQAIELMKGAGVGHNIAKALGTAAVHAIEDGSTRLSSVLDGSDPHSDAHYGEGFPKGSAQAKKAMAKARRAQPSMYHPTTNKTNRRRFIKGSKEAHEYMSQLRAAKGDHTAAKDKDKYDFWDEGLPDTRRKKPVRGGELRGPNPWLEFVKAFRSQHPEKTYKECLSAAAAEWRR